MYGAGTTHESRQSLFLLAASPTLWAAHFLLCYLTAALWCARAAQPGAPLGPVRGAVAAYTVLALGGIAFTGWKAFRRHRYRSGTVPHDLDTPEDRHRFIGFATLLLSALSAVATLFTAAVPLFFGTCR
jgi:hypothetical protein